MTVVRPPITGDAQQDSWMDQVTNLINSGFFAQDTIVVSQGATGAQGARGIAGQDGTTVEEKDYKVDIRVHGRPLNYRIADRGQQAGWSIAGMQFDIGTGGVR